MTDRPINAGSRSRQCRICLDDEDSENLISPCDCKGSIEYVHRGCLIKYFKYRFKAAGNEEKRRMKKRIECEICKHEIKTVRISSSKRCVTCSELRDELDNEDIVFIIAYMVLYIGFHVAGIILLVQNSLAAKIIGSIWLTISFITFNYGLYRLIKAFFIIR